DGPPGRGRGGPRVVIIAVGADVIGRIRLGRDRRGGLAVDQPGVVVVPPRGPGVGRGQALPRDRVCGLPAPRAPAVEGVAVDREGELAAARVDREIDVVELLGARPGGQWPGADLRTAVPERIRAAIADQDSGALPDDE